MKYKKLGLKVLPREGIPQCFKIPDSSEGKQQHIECIYYVLRTQNRSSLLSVYTAVTPEASEAICSAVSTRHIVHHISSGRPHFILTINIHTSFLICGYHTGKTMFLPHRNFILQLATRKYNVLTSMPL